MNILWRGARGQAVKDLQSTLKRLGFDPGDVDGIFGSSTAAAVGDFQRNRRLDADGVVGPKTFSALKLSVPSQDAIKAARSKVFVSYSHADKRWLKMLQLHIAPLERSGMVDIWDDTKISPGKKWREEIATAIKLAKVSVLLVSANFMASEFIAANEMPPLLEAAESEGAVILPVFISPVRPGSLAMFQAVNSPSRSLVDLSRGDRDRVWIALVEAITEALNE